MTNVAQERTDRNPTNDDPHGLSCPLCNCPQSVVIWTRKRTLKINGKVKGAIVRARQCQNEFCGFRYQTKERIDEV